MARIRILVRVKQKLTYLIRRERHDDAEKQVTVEPRRAEPPAPHARPPRRDVDIPIELITETYTPKQTSLKASFRADGEDRQRDQEFARGVLENDRWSDEDHYTNRSGDPRIGTHGRSYEPTEARDIKEGGR